MITVQKELNTFNSGTSISWNFDNGEKIPALFVVGDIEVYCYDV